MSGHRVFAMFRGTEAAVGASWPGPPHVVDFSFCSNRKQDQDPRSKILFTFSYVVGISNPSPPAVPMASRH